MKFITIALVYILSTNLVFAQDEDRDRGRDSQEIKTLFSKGSKVRGFGSLDVKYSEFNKDNSLLVGVKGGVIINRHLILGLGGYGLSSINKFNGIDPNQELFLYGGYGGLLIGYTIAPKEVIHISFPILIAAGGFEISDRNYFNEFRNRDQIELDNTVERSTALVIEPGVEIEINVTKFFRIAVGGSYRVVQGVTLDRNNITDDDLTSWATHASLKFGKFW